MTDQPRPDGLDLFDALDESLPPVVVSMADAPEGTSELEFWKKRAESLSARGIAEGYRLREALTLSMEQNRHACRQAARGLRWTDGELDVRLEEDAADIQRVLGGGSDG